MEFSGSDEIASCRRTTLRVLPNDREGELVVPLGNQCYCVAVPGLEVEGASNMRATAARCVDRKEHPGSVNYTCGRGGWHCPGGFGVLVAILVLYVVAGESGRCGACVSKI